MSAFDSFAKTDWGQKGNEILAGNGIAGRSSTADGAPINGNNAGMGTSTTASNPTMLPGAEGIMGMANGNPTNDTPGFLARSMDLDDFIKEVNRLSFYDDDIPLFTKRDSIRMDRILVKND